MVAVLTIIHKTKDTNIVVVAGNKKKIVAMKKKRNVVVRKPVNKIKTIIVVVVRKIKAMEIMALEILAKTLITVGKNKLR